MKDFAFENKVTQKKKKKEFNLQYGWTLIFDIDI